MIDKIVVAICVTGPIIAWLFIASASEPNRLASVDALLFLIAALPVIGLYLLPAIIAVFRRLSNAASIAVINLFLGWTLVGWVVALAMAVSGTATRRVKTS